MAIHYDKKLARFRDDSGKLVSRDRAMRSSTARAELKATQAKRKPKPKALPLPPKKPKPKPKAAPPKKAEPSTPAHKPPPTAEFIARGAEYIEEGDYYEVPEVVDDAWSDLADDDFWDWVFDDYMLEYEHDAEIDSP